MKKAFLLLIALVLLAGTAFAQNLSVEEAKAVLKGSSLGIHYFDSQEGKLASKFYPLTQDGSQWSLDLKGRDLSFNLNDKRTLGLEFFGRKFLIEFKHDPTDSGNLLVKMWDEKNNLSCFSADQRPTADYLIKDVDYLINTEFYGKLCGIHLEANWEAAFKTDLDVESVSVDERILVEIIQQYFAGRTTGRVYTEQEGVEAVQNIYHALTINYSGSSQNDDMKLLTPELRDNEEHTHFVTDLEQYRISHLPFDVDDADERIMVVSYLGDSWNFEITKVGDRYKFDVVKLSGTNCEQVSQVIDLDAWTSKWTPEMCGIMFYADSEPVGFEDDVEVREIAVSKKIVGKAVADRLRGKDLSAILKYVGEMRELNEVMRTIDIYDATRFQGEGEKQMYVGEPLYFDEGGKLNFLDEVKNRYLAVTANKKVLYILYAKPEWGTNQLWVAKPPAGKEFVLSRQGKQPAGFTGTIVSNTDELANALAVMDEISSKAVELNLKNANDLLAKAAVANSNDLMRERAVEPEETAPVMVEGLSPAQLKDFQAVVTKMERNQAELKQLWDAAEKEDYDSLEANLTPGDSIPVAVGAMPIARVTDAFLKYRQAHPTTWLNDLKTATGGKLTAIKTTLGKAVQVQTYRNLGAFANTKLWSGLFKLRHAYEIARVEAAVAAYEALLGEMVGAGKVYNSITRFTPQAVQDLAAAVPRARAALSTVKAASVTSKADFLVAKGLLNAAKTEYTALSTTGKTVMAASEAATAASKIGGAKTIIQTGVSTADKARKFRLFAAGKDFFKFGGSKVWAAGKGIAKGIGWGVSGVLKTVKLALLPAGPVGWGVLIITTGVDVGMAIYDYTATMTYAYDDARLMVNWDREFWSTHELKINFLVYNGAGTYYEGPTVSFFDVGEVGKQKMSELGMTSLQELITGNKLKLQVYEIISPEIYKAKQNDLTKKLTVAQSLDSEGKPVPGEEVAIILDGKGNGKRITIEKFGNDEANPEKVEEVIVIHDVAPGLYVAKWTMDGKESWDTFSIGIEDFPGDNAEIFPDI